ncbi:MAG: hypothetical protein Q4C60_08900, partial [Eubacteriales bacterium]|nr:hypothetical protein [Eubacteriales bacterium]
MHCLLFSDTNFQKFHDTDIYLHCIHNENQLFDAIQSFNPLLIIIGSEKLSVLSVETLDLLLTQKHLVLLADFICSELFPLLSTLSFDRIVPWEEIHSTPQLFVSSIATTAMNQILAE